MKPVYKGSYTPLNWTLLNVYDVSGACSTAVYLSFIYLQISASINFDNEVRR